MTSMTIKIEAGEIADAMNNLAAAITNMMSARASLLADIATKEAVTKAAKPEKKAQPAVAENTGSNGSAPATTSYVAPVAVATSTPPAPVAPPTVQSEAVASTLNYDTDVGPTMQRVLTEKGAPAVVQILKKYNARVGKLIAVADLPAALADAKLALGE